MLMVAPGTNHKSTEVVKCANEWCKFLRSISAISSVCGLLHPSGKSIELIKSMCSTDITKDPKSMMCLQEEIPVLFELVRTMSSDSSVLKPVLEELLKKALAPFGQSDCGSKKVNLTDREENDAMSFFPYLPKCRNRAVYFADSTGKALTCTKRSSRHPTLLPGVFTLFCEHGKYEC